MSAEVFGAISGFKSCPFAYVVKVYHHSLTDEYIQNFRLTCYTHVKLLSAFTHMQNCGITHAHTLTKRDVTLAEHVKHGVDIMFAAACAHPYGVLTSLYARS